MAVQGQTWTEIRKQLTSSKWRGILSFDESCPYYMHIPTQFSHLSNVLPEEQEEMVFTELKLFLLGNQTENIRIGELDENNLPLSIDVNISFDPFIRSELERFHETLIAISTIKKCCFAITNDTVTYALISATVASAIQEKVDGFVLEVCEKLDALGDSTQQLNSLFREVHTIHESLAIFAEICRKIHVEKLIGGQVLTILDAKRRLIYGGNVLKDLNDVFAAGWRVFAKYIGQLVCKFEADFLSYEFVIWSTKYMSEQQIKQLSPIAKHTKNNRFLIIESLCPKFFTKYLDILVRCAEFGDVGGEKILTQENGEKNCDDKESIKNMMEDVRNVDWQQMDVPTTARMLLQFSRKESTCLLRKITSATNVGQAIKDIHDLLLGGSSAHQIMMHCIQMDILEKPIDEIGNIRLKKLTNKVFHVAAEEDHPFWKHITFRLEKRNVFETLAARMQPGMAVEQNQQYALFECLTVSLNCPIEIEPIISVSAFYGLESIFRIWLQLHVASWKIANLRDSFRGMMPQSGGGGSEMTIRKLLISSLGSEIDAIKCRWVAYISVALSTYSERILKAISLEEYTECQDQLNRDVTRMIGITELSQIEIIKDLLNIIWSFESAESIADLLADLEEVQSRARLGAIAVN
ncbi:unnamed protein product [Caenorhabditis angaria]|uniref:Gamma-tubulin complex component n=1 Tax=Caenorhabditis angaria TaxID=860376 RepID=A0A9P1I6N5_9PELO|nr:unnamed protein product [Caenorhabditis angaria]